MEEIIIDGVDVAGCEFLRRCVIPDNEGCKIDDSLCCDVGNCYYKQFKRLEQENARLKENDCEQCKHLDLYIKYKQTLQEIKAIAEEWKNTPWFCFNCGNNMDEKLKEILDLITKAEEE